MKKILLATLLGTSCMIGTAAMAYDEGSQMHIGYNQLSLGSNNGNGAVYGWNYVIPLKVLGDGVKSGLETGLGFDLGIGSIDVANGSNIFSNGEAKIFAGYHYDRVNIKGTVGYGFLKVGSDSNSMLGADYGISAGFNFSKKWGIEAVYKTGQVSLNSGPGIDISYTGVNIVWKR